MLNAVFTQVAVVIIAAGALSLLAYRLRQPLIIAYILTGILVGPGLLGIVKDEEVFSVMSTLGIAFLLFIVGLNLNWRAIREVGRIALVTGVGQVLSTSFFGFLIGLAIGMPPLTAIFLSVAFAFSSTIIIVKLLTDKEDLDRLYGRISVGMLLVQDMIAMVILLMLAAMRDGGSLGTILSVSLFKAVVVMVGLWLLARFVVPHLFRYAAKSQELLMVSALSWCFMVAGALHLLGFGPEIGALLAGISLSGTGFQHEIESRVRSLRDFFLIVFFIVLGTHLTFASMGAVAGPAIVYSLYVLIGNPLLVFLMMRLMGYHPRTGFLMGLTVAQISEFSFIVLTAGVVMGLIPSTVIPLSAVVGLVTIAVSSYFISYGEIIFDKIAHRFPGHGGLDRRLPHTTHEVLLCGYDRMGQEILPRVQHLTDKYMVIDFDPTVIETLSSEGVSCAYGDASDEDVLNMVGAHHAKMVISTIPDMGVNTSLLEFFKQQGKHTVVIVTVKNSSDAARCYQLGATFVIVPSVMSGQRFGEYLKTRKTSKVSWKQFGKQHASREEIFQ